MTAVRTIAAGLVAGMLSGCLSYRNTALDQRLPRFEPPRIDLSRYAPVQARPGQDPELALAVAVSGGGHRAANFATGVLLGLEDVDGAGRNLLREVDYLSTVSGGGFAAGTYVAALHDHVERGATNRPFSLADALEEDRGRRLVGLRRDYQSSVFQAWYNLRCLGYNDAGDVLEDKFDRYILGAAARPGGRSLRLGDVFRPAGAAPPRLPYWVANGTVYENGVRFPFTPGILADYGVTTYRHRLRRYRLHGKPYTLPLAVGGKASASFPVVIPATTLGCRHPEDPLNRYLHVLDGGLADNLGIRTAFDLLRQDPAPRKVLLVVDAYKGITHPLSAHAASPDGMPVAIRIMKISLDGEHARMKQDVRDLVALAAADGEAPIRVVFLSFEALRPEIEARVREIKDEMARLRSERVRAGMRRARREIEALLRRERRELERAETAAALYRDARAVPTSLSITRTQQSVLLAAGRRVVERHRDRLLESLAEDDE